MGKRTVIQHKVHVEHKREKRLLNLTYLRDYKIRHSCQYCHESNVACLVFHHKLGEKKFFGLSDCRDKAFSRIVAEVKKCVVLCSNCHLKLHARWRLERVEESCGEDEVTLWDVYQTDGSV